MILIIMGVSGSGKSTVGKMLAERIGCKFYDADEFHSKDNIEKMRKGIGLTDKDREQWLSDLRDQVIKRRIYSYSQLRS
jgi:gluconokinase